MFAIDDTKATEWNAINPKGVRCNIFAMYIHRECCTRAPVISKRRIQVTLCVGGQENSTIIHPSNASLYISHVGHGEWIPSFFSVTRDIVNKTLSKYVFFYTERVRWTRHAQRLLFDVIRFRRFVYRLPDDTKATEKRNQMCIRRRRSRGVCYIYSVFIAISEHWE